MVGPGAGSKLAAFAAFAVLRRVPVRTVYKLFTQYLDLFGKPSREFLKKLFPFAQEGIDVDSWLVLQ